MTPSPSPTTTTIILIVTTTPNSRGHATPSREYCGMDDHFLALHLNLNFFESPAKTAAALHARTALLMNAGCYLIVEPAKEQKKEGKRKRTMT